MTIFFRNIFVKEFWNFEFSVKEIRVFFDFCSNCYTSEDYLDELNKIDTSKFCLVHMFTNVDFPHGNVAKGYVGVTCRRDSNTGITSVTNFHVGKIS